MIRYDDLLHIQNFDIRGRFLACSCPNWPKSFDPLEYTLPATKEYTKRKLVDHFELSIAQTP